MENSIAVITVPLEEWKELKNAVVHITKSLIVLEGKSKSEYITPKEVCELLRCSRNTYQSYVDKGILEPIKVKSAKYSKILFKRIDVEYYLQSRIRSN